MFINYTTNTIINVLDDLLIELYIYRLHIYIYIYIYIDHIDIHIYIKYIISINEIYSLKKTVSHFSNASIVREENLAYINVNKCNIYTCNI